MQSKMCWKFKITWYCWLYKKKHACYNEYATGMIDKSNPDHAYMCILNRGGLSIPSLALTEYTCSSFAILNFTENMIKKSTVQSRKAAEVVYISREHQTFTCKNQKCDVHCFTNQIVSPEVLKLPNISPEIPVVV